MGEITSSNYERRLRHVVEFCAQLAESHADRYPVDIFPPPNGSRECSPDSFTAGGCRMVARLIGLEIRKRAGDVLLHDPTPVRQLDLSVRSRKAMLRLGIETVGHLCEKTAEDLLAMKHLGYTSLTEIREKLMLIGSHLKGDPPDPDPS